MLHRFYHQNLLRRKIDTSISEKARVEVLGAIGVHHVFDAIGLQDDGVAHAPGRIAEPFGYHVVEDAGHSDLEIQGNARPGTGLAAKSKAKVCADAGAPADIDGDRVPDAANGGVGDAAFDQGPGDEG